MIGEIVMQCIVNNREEIIRIYNTADRRARRERMPISPVSIRTIMAQCGMMVRTSSEREEGLLIRRRRPTTSAISLRETPMHLSRPCSMTA